VAVGRRQAQRTLERGCLQFRDGRQVAEDRSQELVECGEGQPGLRRGPSPGEHSHGRRVLDGVGEERRLADARLAPNHQATASRRSSVVRNGVDRRALRRSAVAARPDRSRGEETGDTTDSTRSAAGIASLY
jgi:hypothetical protein